MDKCQELVTKVLKQLKGKRERRGPTSETKGEDLATAPAGAPRPPSATLPKGKSPPTGAAQRVPWASFEGTAKPPPKEK